MKSSLLFFALMLGLAVVPAHPSAAPAAAKKKGGKPAKPKRAAPKPHHPKRAKVKPKAQHHARHAPGKAKGKKPPIKTKKAAPKPKHTPKPRVTAKPHDHAAKHLRKDEHGRHVGERERKVEHDNRLMARRHESLVDRSRAWSRTSAHEHAWWHYHWHTHHFASFVGAGTAAAAYHFDWHWWNSYVVNRRSPSWNSVVVAGPAAGGPGPGAGQPPSPPATPAAPVVQAEKAFPLSPQGAALAKLLDDLQVETHWLPGQSVDWRTGTPTNPGETGPASNGGAFVAAVCDRLGAPLAADDPSDFLPASQIEWLMTVGMNKGWVKVGEVEAQVLANQGWPVIAAWKNLAPPAEREVAGQLAVIRPDREPASQVSTRGPRVAVAGLTNRNDTTVKDGFPSGTWQEQEVVYLAHRPRG